MMCSYLPRRALAERSPMFRMLVEYNPFYLISAMFMLGGLFSLNDSLDWSPLPVGNVLILIATLNLYEMLLIGLAIFLHQRGVRRDATMLLVIEAFFLVDAGFLNSEIVTQDLQIGLIVNLILLVLAAVKVACVFRALHLPLRSGPFALVMLQVAVLTTMPGVFKYVSNSHNGALPAVTMYAFWWVIGGIVALYGVLLARVDFSEDTPRINHFGRYRFVIGAFLLLGMVSILAHVCTSNWVYNVRWYTANLAPVLLGLAIALASLEGSVMRYRKRMRAELALPMAAIVISAPFPGALVWGPAHLAPMTPLRLVLLASAMVYSHGMLRFRQTAFAWMSVACVLLASLGSSVGAMLDNIMIFNRSAISATKSVTPKRTVHWGVVSVVTSFMLLAVGMLLSMKKTEEQHEEGTVP
jgi:hypothetical protein